MAKEGKVKSKVIEGGEAPDFELPSQTGEMVRLSDYRGKNVVVLYFYPKDETPGCTKQACAFRDHYDVFQDAGAVVLGVSSDSVESHRGFAQHHGLPFLLLSDVGGKVRKTYGAQTLGLMPGRVTYVIDKKGIVRLLFSSQFSVGSHIEKAEAMVEELSSD